MGCRTADRSQHASSLVRVIKMAGATCKRTRETLLPLPRQRSTTQPFLFRVLMTQVTNSPSSASHGPVPYVTQSDGCCLRPPDPNGREDPLRLMFLAWASQRTSCRKKNRSKCAQRRLFTFDHRTRIPLDGSGSERYSREQQTDDFGTLRLRREKRGLWSGHRCFRVGDRKTCLIKSRVGRAGFNE